MDFQVINPSEIPDWDSLLLRSGDQSFFHSSVWARVLEEAYGYKPVYFASFEDCRLTFLMPFMEVASFLTGRRGVSLPFADRCAPFFLRREHLLEAIAYAIDFGIKAKWGYLEWRDDLFCEESVSPSITYYTHDLDLKLTEPELFSLLKGSNRRNIGKAMKQGVSIEIGQSREALDSFYRLKCMTIKRHGLPPQPLSFFKRVFDYIISKGNGIVVSAHHSNETVAAAIFFHFGKTAVYKYAASDINFQNLRPNNLILWEAIKWYKTEGFEILNLGRTDTENHGLLRFKRSWGGTESLLKYYRYNIKKKVYLRQHLRSNFQMQVFARTPILLLRMIGRLLYRHVG